jgi:hypothetical protein
MLTSFLASGEIQQIQLGFCSLKRELRNSELQKRLEEQMSTTHVVVTTLAHGRHFSCTRKTTTLKHNGNGNDDHKARLVLHPAYVPTPLPTLLVGTCRTYFLWGSFAFASQSFFVAAHCPGLNCIGLVSILLSFMLNP